MSTLRKEAEAWLATTKHVQYGAKSYESSLVGYEAGAQGPSVQKLLDTFESILDCPITVVPETVCKAGIEAAPLQVVVNFHCGYVKYRDAVDVLKAWARGME